MKSHETENFCRSKEQLKTSKEKTWLRGTNSFAVAANVIINIPNGFVYRSP